MAYSLDITLSCALSICRSAAKVEVFNRWNERMGRFCRKHGAERVRELNAAEKINTPSGQPEPLDASRKETP